MNLSRLSDGKKLTYNIISSRGLGSGYYFDFLHSAMPGTLPVKIAYCCFSGSLPHRMAGNIEVKFPFFLALCYFTEVLMDSGGDDDKEVGNNTVVGQIVRQPSIKQISQSARMQREVAFNT